MRDGYLEVSDERPGWGTDFDYDELARHPYNPDAWLPLFRPGWEKREPIGG